MTQHGRENEQRQEEGVPHVVGEDVADPALGLPCDLEVDYDGDEEDDEASPGQYLEVLCLCHGLVYVCMYVCMYVRRPTR